MIDIIDTVIVHQYVVHIIYLKLVHTVDATPPQWVVVPLDLDREGFIQTLRENIPELPDNFELRKVNESKGVIGLEGTSPRDMHNTNALDRSALYIRPKGHAIHTLYNNPHGP